MSIFNHFGFSPFQNLNDFQIPVYDSTVLCQSMIVWVKLSTMHISFPYVIINAQFKDV